MPLAIDKEMIRGLYSQGMTAENIAIQHNLSVHTVRTWANRYGWARPRVEITERRECKKAVISDSLQAASERTRHGLAEEIERQMAVLRQLQVKRRIPDLAERTNAVQTLAKTASTVFGWSAETSTATLDVRSLSAPDPISTGGEQVEPTQPSPALLNPVQPSPDK